MCISYYYHNKHVIGFHLYLYFIDRVMYARNQQYKYNREPVTGGQPITAEQAKVS